MLPSDETLKALKTSLDASRESMERLRTSIDALRASIEAALPKKGA